MYGKQITRLSYYLKKMKLNRFERLQQKCIVDLNNQLEDLELELSKVKFENLLLKKQIEIDLKTSIIKSKLALNI